MNFPATGMVLNAVRPYAGGVDELTAAKMDRLTGFKAPYFCPCDTAACLGEIFDAGAGSQGGPVEGCGPGQCKRVASVVHLCVVVEDAPSEAMLSEPRKKLLDSASSQVPVSRHVGVSAHEVVEQDARTDVSSFPDRTGERE